MNFDYRNNVDDSLNLKNLSICKNLIIQNKVEIIGKGIQGEVFKAKSPDCGSVVIKRKLIREEDKKWKNNEKWMRDELETEYKIMLLTNRMIDKFICPNFIKVYDFNKSIPLIIMEYADGDCRFLFKNEYYDTEIYMSFLFQVLMSIYCFNNYTMLFHRDVKLENILYKKIDKKLVFHYKIENKDYYIPTCGYLFMLCDYGTAKFKLDGRDFDVTNLDYKIIKNYVVDVYKTYSEEFQNNKNIESVIKTMRTSEDIPKINSLDKIILEIISIIKNIKTTKMNNFIFQVHEILTFDLEITKIFNNFFMDYVVNKYSDENIINFNIIF